MNPALKAIFERCEFDMTNLVYPTDNFNSPSKLCWRENQRLMPIIRELCEVIEEQQKALEMIGDSNHGKDCDLIADKLAKIALDSTTKRLEQLGFPENK